MSRSARGLSFGSAAMAVTALVFASALASLPTEAAAAAPRLVVLIVIDQFRQDYLRRHRRRFLDGGFNRFLDEGAAFTEARYLHATTDTCPGHAVISTGTWGQRNGIVSNRWFDVMRGKPVECSEPDWRGPAGNLLRPTVGDVLKEATRGRARVIAVSGKRAGAVLLGGQAADAAYWWNDAGRMVTSDSAGPLPAWVVRYNDSEPSKAWFGESWEALLPPDAYAEGGGVGSAVAGGEGLGVRFPHPARDGLSGSDTRHDDFHAAFKISPFVDEVLISFSMTAILEEKLGRDRVTDLLAISLSSNDRVGHRYGPDSPETLDTIVRTDRLLARLLDFLDREIGLDRTLLVLTSDHGVAPLPEVSEMRPDGPAAARVPDLAPEDAVNDALNAACGRPESGKWVAFHDFPNLYLNQGAIRSNGACGREAERLARDAVAEVPGIESAFTRKQLTEWAGSYVLSEPVRMALRSFRPDRSGHVVYQVAPLHVVSDRGTNHGSHWDYDTHVPLLWLGRSVRQGTYDGAVSPADIAPTLHSLLGISGSIETAGCALNAMLSSPLPASRECRPED